MAIKIIEEMMYCRKCNKNTLHRKNSKQMSWLMHLFLTVITAGAWLIIWLLILGYHAISKATTALGNSWICSECGNKF